MYFPWTVCDYPLAQAVEDRIVKAPLIVTKEDDPKQPKHDPENVTKDNVGEKYGYWLRAAVQRWKEHWKRLQEARHASPCSSSWRRRTSTPTRSASTSGRPRSSASRSPRSWSSTPTPTGEITKKDLDKAREAARDIDKPENKIKAIVSVMMLREGWDVRNVTVVLGLRPFTAKAEILPEQVIGRGLAPDDRTSARTAHRRWRCSAPATCSTSSATSSKQKAWASARQGRSAAAGHHRAGAGAPGLRHRDPDHQAEP